MMQPSESSLRRAASWVVFVGAVGCTPPTGTGTGTEKRAEPPKVEAKSEPTKVVPTPEPKVVPVPVVPVPVPVPGETLDDRPLLASNEGAWTLRRAGPGTGGGFDGFDGGSIGKGGGTGSGRGYGSGGGGAREEESMDMASARPASPAPKRAEAGPRVPGGVPGGIPDGGAIGGTLGAPAKTGKMREPAPAAPLKAGSTDDNADFKGYLKFLTTWTGREDVRGSFQPLDVAGRVFIKVVDGDRQPVPGAMVTVSDPSSGATLWKATTYGDGQAPYYPKLFGPGVQPVDRMEVTATFEAETVKVPWDGKSDLTVPAKARRSEAGMGLDVLFLIDTTGSMGDELERIKTSLLQVTAKVQGRREGLTLRYAAVAYKDINDDYVTMAHPFTEDVNAFSQGLQALSAGGGGDLPESLNQGLARSVEGVEWRPGAAKVVFLVADAPPQMRFKGDILYGDSALKAVTAGIRIHSVAASGLDPLGTLVLRQVAQLTRGKFIFIEYGSTQATASKHGVSGPVEGGNNLDDILLKQLTAEIDGWGK